MNMSENLNLLSLPDLVLHNICSLISSPFHLLNLGCTCTKLYKVTSAQSLWWNIAVDWLNGIWYCIDNVPPDMQPREWFLKILRDCTMKPTGTKLKCNFKSGEVWNRIESQEFRCYLGMLQLAYVEKLKERHPGVLYERWLYDIGLYSRENPSIDFEERSALTKENVIELASLGQAKERDLRARKQPYIDPMYYVKIVSTSRGSWINDLFPCGPFGSKCPLLICPFQDALNTEVSGLSGLLICLTVIVEKYVIAQNKSNMASMVEVACTIRSAVQGFADMLMINYSQMKQMWGRYCLTSAIQSMASEDVIDLTPWQTCLDTLGTNVQCKLLIKDLQSLIQTFGGIDSVVNSIRSRWRKCLLPEIEHVLSVDSSLAAKVTRVNLTDSDFIGGDNRRQEMSAAVFVSESGVLATWQLIGRLRY